MGFLGDTVSMTLENGVRLCCLSRPGSSVEMQFHVGAGSIFEQEHLGCGLSHFLEHMSFQGCAGYPGRLVAAEVNRLGGDVNAYTSYDRTCYRMQLPREHWRSGVAMLAAMVRHPEFPEERFPGERVKTQTGCCTETSLCTMAFKIVCSSCSTTSYTRNICFS